MITTRQAQEIALSARTLYNEMLGRFHDPSDHVVAAMPEIVRHVLRKEDSDA